MTVIIHMITKCSYFSDCLLELVDLLIVKLQERKSLFCYSRVITFGKTGKAIDSPVVAKDKVSPLLGVDVRVFFHYLSELVWNKVYIFNNTPKLIIMAQL